MSVPKTSKNRHTRRSSRKTQSRTVKNNKAKIRSWVNWARNYKGIVLKPIALAILNPTTSVTSVVATLGLIGYTFHNGKVYNGNNGKVSEEKTKTDNNIYFINRTGKLVNIKKSQFKNEQNTPAYVMCFKNIKAQVVRLEGDRVIVTKQSLKISKEGKIILLDVKLYDQRTPYEKLTFARLYNDVFTTNDGYVSVPLYMVHEKK